MFPTRDLCGAIDLYMFPTRDLCSAIGLFISPIRDLCTWCYTDPYVCSLK